VPIEDTALETLTFAIERLNTAESAWQRRVALDLYRAVATPELVEGLLDEYVADAPTNAQLDRIAADLRHAAVALEAFGTNPPPETAGFVAVITITGNIGRNDMAYVLQIGQEADLTVEYQDAQGNTAQVESDNWTSSDDAVLTVNETGDGTATIAAVATGTAQVQLVADARMGDDVNEIRAVLDVEVVAAEAVSATITPGEPRNAGGAGGGGGETPEA
jgi:hypothetical protein